MLEFPTLKLERWNFQLSSCTFHLYFSFDIPIILIISDFRRRSLYNDLYQHHDDKGKIKVCTLEGFVFDCLFVCLILYILQKCWYNWIFFIFHISCCVNIYVLLYWKRLVWTNTNTSLVHSFFCDIHVLYSEILTRYQLKTTLESPTFTCKWTFYFKLKIALANIKVGNSKIKFKKTPKWIYKDYSWKF